VTCSDLQEVMQSEISLGTGQLTSTGNPSTLQSVDYSSRLLDTKELVQGYIHACCK
jgi:hypothetical protein